MRILAFLFILCTAASAQVGPPYFPQTLPSGTVVGRIQAGTGPAQAVPFAQLSAALFGTGGPATFPLFATSTGIPTGPLSASATISNQQPTHGNGPVWNRIGVAIDPTVSHCSPAGGSTHLAAERGMLYEGNPKILTQYTNVFKMWFHSYNGSTNEIDYAESADGLSWTCYASNPVISGTYDETHSIVKNGSTYILYPRNTSTLAFDRFTSPDGLVWTLTNSSVVAPALTWEGSALYNAFVWMEDSTHWYMMYGGEQGGGNPQKEGLATSADGITWVKSASNPVITDGTSGAFVYKSLGGTYYFWSQVQFAGLGSAVLPSDIARYSSTNLTTWTRAGYFCTFCRGTTDEGPGSNQAQVADPNIIQVNGKTYLYYGADADQSGNGNIKVAVANMTLEQLITTTEGDLPNWWSALLGNPAQFGAGNNNEHINLQFGVQYGVVGFGAHYDRSPAIAADTAGAPGFMFRWQNTDSTNANARFTEQFVDSSGTAHATEQLTWDSSGNPLQYEVGAPTLCLLFYQAATCRGSIQTPGSGLYIFGSADNPGDSLGDLLFGYARLTEIAAPSGSSGNDFIWGDSTAHRPKMNSNNGTTLTVGAIVAQGATAVGGNSITSLACDSVVTAGATNALTTDSVSWAFNAVPGTNWPKVTVQVYLTAGNVNFLVCNPSAGSTTPAAATLNWSVIR